MSAKPKSICLLRAGNPWLVGTYVNRIVPVFALQSFAATQFVSSPYLQTIRDLARGDPDYSRIPCFDGWTPSPTERRLVQDCAFAVFAPDRRIFRTHGGTGPAMGSPTPLVAGLADASPSDEGLGKRMSQLMSDCAPPDWADRLNALLTVPTPRDPVTAFVVAMLQGTSQANRRNPQERSTVKRSFLEANVARFVYSLLRDVDDGRRLIAIQEFGRGLYFGAIWLLIGGPIHPSAASLSKDRQVLAYAGLPPGSPNDPLVMAAARSFQRAIDGAWNGLASTLARRLKGVRVPSTIERRRDQAEHRLAGVMDGTDKEKAGVAEALSGLFPRDGVLDEDWCSSVMDSTLDFSTAEYARRVRSLGANIGLAGPDRGKASPRFFCETPLLATLVQGVCAGTSMRFEDFVQRAKVHLGIVFGPGDDDETWRILGPIWGGHDGEELLRANEELLRRRLVRAGIARTYSDSHTEVIPLE